MVPPRFNRSFGMILLAFWLILSGLTGILAFSLPPLLLPFVAIVAGVLILLGE
jgi:hypothetical protein